MSETTNSKKPVVKIIVIAIIGLAVGLFALNYKRKQNVEKYNRLSEEAHKVFYMTQDTKKAIESATGGAKVKLQERLKKEEQLFNALEEQAKKYRP